MKSYFLKKIFFFIFLLITLIQKSYSQVPLPDTATTGWPAGLATIKWDNRNYLVTTGNYNNYVSTAMSTTQAFSIGTNRVTIAMGTGISTTGQNTVNSGYANSYGTPSTVFSNGGTALNSVSYNGNGTVTLTFDTLVSHVAFSLYDIDSKQVATVTAKDGSGNALVVKMANASASGVNTITGSGLTSAAAGPAIFGNHSCSGQHKQYRNC